VEETFRLLKIKGIGDLLPHRLLQLLKSPEILFLVSLKLVALHGKEISYQPQIGNDTKRRN